MSLQHPVKTVQRAVHILNVLARSSNSSGIAEVSEELGVSQSTVHRILATLVDAGYVTQDPLTQRYSLGLEIVALTSAVLNQLELRKQAISILDRLTSETSCNANLAILYRRRVFYIARVNSPKTSKMYVVVGRRAPAHGTALGKAMLAFSDEEELEAYLHPELLTAATPSTITDRDELVRQLKKVRDVGYAVDRSEYIEGIHCIAAPVRDETGRVVAAISLSGSQHQITDENQQELAGLLLDASLELSSRIGYST